MTNFDKLGKISIYYNNELLDTKEIILDKDLEYYDKILKMNGLANDFNYEKLG